VGAHPAGGPPAVRPATPWLAGGRQDLRTAAVVVLVLAVSGLLAGLVWLWLAPRADFRVTANDVVAIGGPPSDELFMADDGVFVLVLAVLGLLAGLAVWRLRRRRGVVTLAGLVVGTGLAGLVAWQLGRVLGEGPTKAELAHVGARVTTKLDLGSPTALAVAPFFAVVVYLVAASFTPDDDLRREQ
jgi:Protein of unknown function (DUF2567)